jgi:hypothetical protein
MRLLLIIYLLLTFTGPLVIALSGQIDFRADWRTANRIGANLSPDPTKTSEAVIKDGKHYKVYQAIGWRLMRGMPLVTTGEDLPDRYWFDQKPRIILDIRGEAAEKLIPAVEAAVLSYPYSNEYRYWPGPNSNTFTAHIAHAVPALQLALPSNAVGKDYLPTFFARAPSGTGYQFSLYGLFGILIAKKEGLEINILGLVYGISPMQGVIKLPGFGDISFIPKKPS